MAKQYYQLASVTGVINTTVYDTGLESTEEQVKKCTGIVVNMSTHIGNTIEVWLERERIAQIPDFCLDTREAAGGANAYKSATKMGFIRLDVEIPYGQTLKVAVASGATANDLSGAYQYEEM